MEIVAWHLMQRIQLGFKIRHIVPLNFTSLIMKDGTAPHRAATPSLSKVCRQLCHEGPLIFDKCMTRKMQVDLVPEAGHYPFLDQPEVFLQKLLRQTLSAFPHWPGHSADAR